MVRQSSRLSPGVWLTAPSSAKGSASERSSGFSRSLRKWSLRAEYALLESESFFGHVDLSRFSNKRNACKHESQSTVNLAAMDVCSDLPANRSEPFLSRTVLRGIPHGCSKVRYATISLERRMPASTAVKT